MLTYSLCSVDLFKLLARFQGAVWAAIVDHNDLKVEVSIGEGLDEQPDDDREVFFLIVGWQQYTVLVTSHLCNRGFFLPNIKYFHSITSWKDFAMKMHGHWSGTVSCSRESVGIPPSYRLDIQICFIDL